MKQKIAFIFLCAAVLICLILPIWIGISPSPRAWKDYNVLAVRTNVPEQTVLELLEKSGIRNTISLSHSGTYPFRIYSADVRYNISNYFYDKTHEYQLYYIPAVYNSVERILHSSGFDFVLNSTDSISYVPSFFTAAAFILFCIFSRKKVFFGLLHAPAVLYAFICPYYSAAAAASLVFFPGFILQRLYPRTGYLKEFFRTASAYLFYGSAVVFILLCGLRSAAAAADCIALSLCLLRIYKIFEKSAARNSRSFIPVPILSAKKIEKVQPSALPLAAVPSAAAIACIITVFVLQTPADQRADVSQSNTVNRLSIPAPVEYTSVRNFNSLSYMEMYARRAEQLTAASHQHTENDIFFNDMSDYLALNWQCVSMPYRKVADEKPVLAMPRIGDSVFFPDYVKNKDGTISYDEKKLFTFDESFIKNTIGLIKASDFPYPEKLMISQGSFFSAKYITPQRISSENYLIYRLTGIVIIPVVYVFFIILKWRKHGTRQQTA